MNERETASKAIHALVHGRVQGVGFRYWTRSTASGLGLAGWVRNRDDGSVEIFFQGMAERVDRFAQLIEKGPPGAEVRRVDSKPVTPRESYTRFSITI